MNTKLNKAEVAQLAAALAEAEYQMHKADKSKPTLREQYGRLASDWRALAAAKQIQKTLF